MSYIDKWKDTQDDRLEIHRAESAMLKNAINTLELLSVSLDGSAPTMFVEGYRAAIQTIEELKEDFDEIFDTE